MGLRKLKMMEGITADKARLGLAILGSIAGLELVVICVLSFTPGGVPAEMWDVLRLTIAMLTGAVGSQVLNGKVKKE